MRPKDITALIDQVIERGNHTPLFISGPPGVGKSAVVKQVAERHAIGFLDIRMTLLDPTDLRGIPVPRDGAAYWLPPSFLPDAKRDGDAGVLFLDEINAAPPLVQASGYQLVLDRRVGEYTLPDGWIILAAGNRQGDRAVVHRMPSPLANRFVHIDFDVNLDDWTDWAIRRGIANEVIGFLHFRPELLFAFDPQRDERAFPTPRSWEFAARLSGLPRNLLSPVIVGTVGEGAAAEYLAYLDVYRDLPDIDKILNGGNEIPERRDLKYATITALGGKAEAHHIEHLVTYSMKYPEEFSVLLMKLLQKSIPKALGASRAYEAWVRKHADLLV